MHESDEPQLTPARREELRSLRQGITPGQMMEERTVKALRDRGLLNRTGRPRLKVWHVAASAAAVAIFAVGVVVGQLLGGRMVTGAVIAANEQSLLNQAARVQEAGSAYVNALAVLSKLSESGTEVELRQSREVAVNALYAAAGQLVGIVPEDPLSVAIREAFRLNSVADEGRRQSTQQTVWF